MTTPRQAAAEMRTAAAETARRFEPDERSDIDYASDLIRALPLPAEATEPADIARMKAALEMARDALTEIQTRSNEMMTGRVSYLNRIENLSVTAIAAIREALGEK